MPEILLKVLRVIVDLVDAAMGGDDDAMAKISSILPEETATELESARQDHLDDLKYGRRR